jgi:shikimate kinase
MKSHRPIVITGFMGCGKSEVARCLASRLSVEMIDLDEFITSETARTPARLIDEDGEEAFRKIETNALTTVLKNKSQKVIALGGGAWIEPRNRDLLSGTSAITIFLDTPFEVCWTRIESAPEDRPLGRTKEQAYERYQRRLPIYRLAAFRIEASAEDSPDEIAAKVQAQVSQIAD